MSWFIAAFLIVVLYAGYQVVDTFTAGAVSGYVIPYFLWIHPNELWGNLLLSTLFILPLYLVLNYTVRAMMRGYADIGYPHWMWFFRLSETRRRAVWALFLVIGLGAALVQTLLVLASARIQIGSWPVYPSSWVVGVVVWLGLLANFLSAKPPPRESQKRAPEDEEVLRGWLDRPSSSEFVEKLRAADFYRGQLVWTRREEAEEAVKNPDVPEWLQMPVLKDTVERLGIGFLYRHQGEFLNALEEENPGTNERCDACLATPVGSGKATVCALVALDRVLNRSRNVLYVSPSRPAAEQHFARFNSIVRCGPWHMGVMSACFVTDEPDRGELRAPPDVLFTIPTFLHRYILPKHAEWTLFLAGLDLIVITDLEDYDGLYARNVSLVFRRLLRVCERSHETRPQLAVTGLSVERLRAFVEELTGRSFADEGVITTDAAGRAQIDMVFWQPPFIWQEKALVSERLSPALRREDYPSACLRLLLEACCSGFRTVFLNKQTTFAERDIRTIDEQLQQHVQEMARADYVADFDGAKQKLATGLTLLRNTLEKTCRSLAGQSRGEADETEA